MEGGPLYILSACSCQKGAGGGGGGRVGRGRTTATGFGRSREEIGRSSGLVGSLGAWWRRWSMWKWVVKRRWGGLLLVVVLVAVVVVRSSGSWEEVGGVDMRRREIENGGGELDSLGGASLLSILNSLTCK